MLESDQLMTTVAPSMDRHKPAARALVGALALATVLWGACTEPERGGSTTPPSRVSGQLRAPDMVARVGFDELTRVPLTAGQVVLRGGWGAGPAQFGRRDEASRPGPMSLDVDHRGVVSILDQVNRRVVQYRPGARAPHVLSLQGAGAETSEFLAVAGDGQLWVLAHQRDPLPGLSLSRYHETGGLQSQVRLPASLKLATGLFVQRHAGVTQLWLEQRHWWQVRLAVGEVSERALGRVDRSRPATRLIAEKAGRRLVRVSRVHDGRYSSPMLELTTPEPLLAIHQLTTDRHGALYLGLLLGRQAGPPGWELEHVRRVMVVHRGPGQRGQLVQLEHGMATDRNRDLAVSPQGALYQLFSTNRELRVRRWGIGP